MDVLQAKTNTEITEETRAPRSTTALWSRIQSGPAIPTVSHSKIVRFPSKDAVPGLVLFCPSPYTCDDVSSLPI